MNVIVQPRKTAPQFPKKTENRLIRLYALILKLYPAGFRAVFTDEMLDVFAQTVNHVHGNVGLVLFLGRELWGLLVSLISVHRQSYRQLTAQAWRIQKARWFVRIIALLLGLFLLSTLRILLSPDYHLYTQAVPFVALLFITSVSMLLAIRWERLGGLLTGSGGVALGIFMGLYLSQIATSAECSAIAIVLIGVLWSLPFVIFGALFHQLSQHPAQQLLFA